MPRFLIPLLLIGCSFASAQDAPDLDLRPDHEPVALQPQDYIDVHESVVQAQLDADAMLADVAAAHDAEAAIVLRERVTVQE